MLVLVASCYATHQFAKWQFAVNFVWQIIWVLASMCLRLALLPESHNLLRHSFSCQWACTMCSLDCWCAAKKWGSKLQSHFWPVLAINNKHTYTWRLHNSQKVHKLWGRRIQADCSWIRKLKLITMCMMPGGSSRPPLQMLCACFFFSSSCLFHSSLWLIFVLRILGFTVCW